MKNGKCFTLNELSTGRVNNFDFLRFIAAVLVIFSHSFSLSNGDSSREILRNLTGGQETFGSFAVKVFFIISGFLITQSYDRSRNIVAFLKARLLRIYPGVIVVIFLSAFVLGPAVTEISISDYFKDIRTYKYLLSASIIKGWDSLPGVFEGNIFKGAVNGSLWTLRYELECYVIVGILGLMGLIRKRVILPGFLVVYLLHFVNLENYNFIHNSIRFLTYFMAGAVTYVYRDKIKISRVYAAVSLTALWTFSLFGLLKASFPVFGTYLIINLAFCPDIKLHSFAAKGDFSYGLYIFAFPIQQIIVMLFKGSMNSYMNFAIAFPIVLVLAFLSWHLIEKQCLKLKKLKVIFPKIIVPGDVSKKYIN